MNPAVVPVPGRMNSSERAEASEVPEGFYMQHSESFGLSDTDLVVQNDTEVPDNDSSVPPGPSGTFQPQVQPLN